MAHSLTYIRGVSYEFADFSVDPVGFRLTKAGRPIAIEPKALAVLIVLIQRRDGLVSKQELLDDVWRDVVVTENALTRAIAQLRKTLGDHADAPRYIETVPTRGYRFIAPLNTARSVVAPQPGTKSVAASAIAASAITLLVLVSSALVALNVLRRNVLPPRGTPPRIAAHPFRVSDRFEVSPSFSPDGASIAYGAEVDGILHLFVADMRGGAERQLTSGRGEAQPAWSPDGKTIAYTAVQTGGIWLIDTTAGAPMQLTTFGSRPSWSPDGTEIAFQSADDIEYGWNAYDALPPSTIFIVNVASRKVAALTTAGWPRGGHGAPAWRRDGRRIAFSSCDHERCGIFTIGRDSSGLTQVWTDPRRASSPVFSVDGSTLYYVLSLYNESLLLGAPIGVDGQPAGPCSLFRESNPGVIQHVTMSLDGSRFAWSVVEEKSELFAVDTGSNNAPVQVTNDRMVNATFPGFPRTDRKSRTPPWQRETRAASGLRTQTVRTRRH